MPDRILTEPVDARHPVQARRLSLGWTQGELARRAGLPRSTLSAIESRHMTPSVVAALALSRALTTPVELLFDDGASTATSSAWAWEPSCAPARYWRAEVAGRDWRYPAEVAHNAMHEHDGVAGRSQRAAHGSCDPSTTLVIAGCDPALGLLASSLARASRWRVLAFQRGGAEALELLATGRVHVAALHRSTPEDPDRNARALRARLGAPCRMLRAADWEEGVALPRQSRMRDPQSCRRHVRRWAVREAGSAAHECLEELLGRAPASERAWRSHAAVAQAVQQGFAEAGICVRICAEEAGLKFLPVRKESLDLCFPEALEGDPRIQSLVRFVGSREHRERLRDLPGYDVTHTGALAHVDNV